MGQLTIVSNGIVKGGACNYGYAPESQKLSFAGHVTIKMGFFQTTQPFSGSQVVPAVDLLSAQVEVGKSFNVNGYTFTCTSLGDKNAVFAVSGANCSGTFAVSLATEYLEITAVNVSFDYSGFSGTLIAHN